MSTSELKQALARSKATSRAAKAVYDRRYKKPSKSAQAIQQRTYGVEKAKAKKKAKPRKPVGVEAGMIPGAAWMVRRRREAPTGWYYYDTHHIAIVQLLAKSVQFIEINPYCPKHKVKEWELLENFEFVEQTNVKQ